MRIERIDAKAFGPFSNAALDFAPGMTLVFGPNESGKSTLHAATYAGLCGRQRRAGGMSAFDREFGRKHRPWGDGPWSVGATVALADGRRIRLSHDLARMVDCRAIDADLGTDVSASLMNAGSPDGSVLLGLTRESFAAVAVVNQAQLLAILGQADGLQHELQRAAASAPADRPAAAAIAEIEKFRAEHVGTARARMKPLAQARAAEAAARGEVLRARESHEQYLRLVESAEAAATVASDAISAERTAAGHAEALEQLDAAVAALARSREEELRGASDVRDAESRHRESDQALRRATELHERFGGREPAGFGEADDLARRAAAALTRWRGAPSAAVPAGESAAALRARLDALPARPQGDAEVHPTVAQAAAVLDTARGIARQAVVVPKPEALTPVQENGRRIGTAALRDLAARLDSAPDPAAAAARAEAAERAQAQAAEDHDAASTDESRRHRAKRAADEALQAAEAAADDARRESLGARPGPHFPMLAVAAVLAVGGAALFGIAAAAGGLLVLVGAVLAAIALRRGPAAAPTTAPDGEAPLHAARAAQTRAAGDLAEAERRLQRASAAVASAQASAEAATRHHDDARAAGRRLAEQCRHAGVPSDGALLRAAADRIEAWQRESELHESAERSAMDQRERIDAADRGLRDALSRRGAANEGPVDAAYDGYRTHCRERAEQERRAAAGPALRSALEQRTAVEDAATRAAGERSAALADLVRAAADTGLTDAEESEAGAATIESHLDRWLDQRSSELGAAQQAQRDWSTLQELLRGGSLADLATTAARREAELTDLREAAEGSGVAVRERVAEVSALALAAGLPPGTVLAPQGREAVASALRDARAVSGQRAGVAKKLHGEAIAARATLEERAAGIVPVAEAADELSAAAADLARLEGLDETLHITLSFLQAAQHRVHRDIAPKLRDAIEGRLGRVTGGRYTKVIINPETLKVQVAPDRGEFVDAERLSFGTAEQVYLLLRVALAEMLGSKDEPCPLLLDDVTVHADTARTEHILQTLLDLAQERQIILFSQEQEVLAWARRRLADSPQHKVITLDPVPVHT